MKLSARTLVIPVCLALTSAFPAQSPASSGSGERPPTAGAEPAMRAAGVHRPRIARRPGTLRRQAVRTAAMSVLLAIAAGNHLWSAWKAQHPVAATPAKTAGESRVVPKVINDDPGPVESHGPERPDPSGPQEAAVK
jgi:hypothetical protein